uniref:Uncharacterized protein n=1 Tax=Anguilla anguilla TaxID=7936 RepID=A0A0E9R8A3_ANGAN
MFDEHYKSPQQNLHSYWPIILPAPSRQLLKMRL